MHLQKPMLGTPLDWSNPLNKGLVMHLAMNEGHGNRVYDLSMNGNRGVGNGFAHPPTVVSGWNPGIAGVGLNFDGTSDYIDCGNQESLQITGAFTISAIIKTSSNGQILGKFGDANADGWAIECRNDRFGFGVRVGGANWLYRGDTITTDNIFHIVAAVYYSDGSTPSLYVDGDIQILTKVLEVGDALNGLIDSGKNVEIGRNHGFSSGYVWFTGSIDQPRVLNRAYTAKEAKDYSMNPWGVHLDD
jgi:hypothetical protein